MQPSRRAAIRLIAAVPLSIAAGCVTRDRGSAETAVPTAAGGTETQIPTTADESVVEARLHGPERTRFLFDGSDIESVGPVTENRVTVSLSDAATTDVAATFRSAGVPENTDDFEIVQRHDGREIGRFGVTQSLASAIADGEWDGQLQMRLVDAERAAEVRSALTDAVTDTAES
ncbi:hypothetical protein ACOZ4I_16665 [Haloarcula salina]|uniref:hypothetical protein n=1 Tax=Haloarcula salina TaxID=1429914 RepID=UPI003C6F5291